MSDGLRAIRDLGVGDWSLDAVDAAVEDALTRERAHTDNRGRRHATMNIATVLGMGTGILIALGVAVVALGGFGGSHQRVRVPAGAGSSVVLARAFPVLARPARPVDLAPPGLEPAGLDAVRGASRQVYTHGAARMWLVPGHQLICLVGTRVVTARKHSSSVFALLARCAPRAVAVTRGLISLSRTQGAFSSAAGILPVGASELAALSSRNRSRAAVRHQLTIPLNQARVFVIRFAFPVTAVRYTASDGRAVTYRASSTKAPAASG
jgi:hypothetical protein